MGWAVKQHVPRVFGKNQSCLGEGEGVVTKRYPIINVKWFPKKKFTFEIGARSYGRRGQKFMKPSSCIPLQKGR